MGITNNGISVNILRDVFILQPYNSLVPTRIMQHNKAVICFFADGSKTVSIPSGGDEFDLEKGVAMCVTKRVLGGYSGVKRAIEGVKRITDNKQIQIVEWDDIWGLTPKMVSEKYGRFCLCLSTSKGKIYAIDNGDWKFFDTESEARAWLRERGAK